MSQTPDPDAGTAASDDGASPHRHGARWSLSKYEDKPKGTWVLVELVLDCGCELYAKDGETIADDHRHFREFMSEVRDQYGWNIDAKWGWSSHTNIDAVSGRRDTVNHVRVQRATLTQAHQMQP